MGCGSCGKSGPGGAGAEPPMFSGDPALKKNVAQPRTRKSVMQNIREAASKQPNPIGWFKDGITGLFKCAIGRQDYSDSDIQINRDVCRTCDHSTKSEAGELTARSQCMAPDPEKNGAPCGCIIMCKTQVGECPLKKWATTKLTVRGENLGGDVII